MAAVTPALRRPRALVLSALSLGTGSGLRARYLAQALQRLGWDARLAAPAGGPRPYSAEIVLGLPQLVRAAAQPVDLAVAIKPYPDAWAALARARSQGAACVVDVDDADGGYRGGALALLTRALQAPAFRVTPWLSTHHPLLKQRLQSEHPSSQVLDLPQGVDLGVFDAGSRRREGLAWRRRSGLQRGPLLGFSAHLNVACQLDFLLQAAGPWLLQHPSAHLVVAGGGPDEAAFRGLARSQAWGAQILFLGPVTPQQAARVLAASDVSVSAYGPSEGNRYRVPMKVAESLALGRPVVSNLVPGLQPLEPCLFSSSLEPAAYGRALDQALRGGAPRALRGQAWVRRHLDWTGVAERFLAQLRDLRPGLPFGSGERA